MKDPEDELDAIVKETAEVRRTLDARANQFAFAGLAAVWIFRIPSGPLALPADLSLPAALFMATLAWDFADLVVQYAVQSDPLRMQRWLHSSPLPRYLAPLLQKKSIGTRGTFTIPLSRALFIVKLVCLGSGFVSLFSYVLAHAGWAP